MLCFYGLDLDPWLSSVFIVLELSCLSEAMAFL